jgi:hypothetical protein
LELCSQLQRKPQLPGLAAGVPWAASGSLGFFLCKMGTILSLLEINDEVMKYGKLSAVPTSQ